MNNHKGHENLSRENKLLVICAVLLLFPTVCASNNFRINSTSGELFFVNGTSGNVTASGTGFFGGNYYS